MTTVSIGFTETLGNSLNTYLRTNTDFNWDITEWVDDKPIGLAYIESWTYRQQKINKQIRPLAYAIGRDYTISIKIRIKADSISDVDNLLNRYSDFLDQLITNLSKHGTSINHPNWIGNTVLTGIVTQSMNKLINEENGINFQYADNKFVHGILEIKCLYQT